MGRQHLVYQAVVRLDQPVEAVNLIAVPPSLRRPEIARL